MWIFLLLAIIGFAFGIAILLIRRGTPESERHIDPREQPPVERPSQTW